MINYYQPFLWPFLHKQRSLVPSGVKQTYWLSFEDALWELLPQRDIAQGSLVLIPDFYCMDVVENIRAHGYRTEFYQLDDQFQINESAFKARVTQVQPAVVVLFHAAGLQCKLVSESVIQWLGQQKCLVIEDCVHRLVDPSHVKLFGSHHLVMDSLRKVSPLPGSMVYELHDAATFKPRQQRVATNRQSSKGSFVEYLYQYRVAYWFAVFQLTQWAAVVSRLSWLMRFAHQVILKKHDDLVGDSCSGYLGWGVWRYLHSHIDYEKLCKLKEMQAKQYAALFQPVFKQRSEFFYQVSISVEDQPRLHVYPLGLRKPLSSDHLHWLHKQGVVVWPKFPDSPWAKSRGVLFLPLGYHISSADIALTVRVVSQLPDPT